LLSASVWAPSLLNVAGTGIAAQYYGAEAAEGFFHEFSGWLVFMSALALILVTMRLLLLLAPRQQPAALETAPTQ